MRRNSSESIIRLSGIPSFVRSDESHLNHMPCNIWAITAMNENEIQMHVLSGLLDGISVKPLSLKQVEKIINKSNIKYVKSDNNE
jgi:recombinational DNA repair protein RecR